MKKIILLLTAFFITVSLGAIDAGLILDQYAKVNREPETTFNYQMSLIPRVSILGDRTELFASGSFSVGYDDGFYFFHEILRTDFSYLFDNAKLNIGRMEYSAPFEYLAGSLFDGFQFTYNSHVGAFSVGAWYTGFLYKRNACIIMTDEDYSAYVTAVDNAHFSETYFASRRLLAALSWEHPAVAQHLRIKTALIAQMDLNGRGENSLNSQYITAKFGLPVKNLIFEAGWAFQLAQTNNGISSGAAGELGVFWAIPSSFPSQFSVSGYFSSGDTESGFDTFLPINSKSFGAILNISHSGFSAISIGYTVRMHKTFSLNLNSSLVFQSLSGTYTNYLTDKTKEPVLGSEFYALLVWSPASDLQINLGSGIGLFKPEMIKANWHMKLSLTRSLY